MSSDSLQHFGFSISLYFIKNKTYEIFVQKKTVFNDFLNAWNLRAQLQNSAI